MRFISRTSTIVLAILLAVATLRNAAADDAAHLLRHSPHQANLFTYVDWDRARAADPALLRLAHEQFLKELAPYVDWQQLRNVKASFLAAYVPFGEPDTRSELIIVWDGHTPPPPAEAPQERTKIRGIEMTTMTGADFAMARLGGFDLGGSPADVRAAIERARPRGKGRRTVPGPQLSAGVREALSMIGSTPDFWWLIYWGDSPARSKGDSHGIAVTARLAGRPDLVTIEVLWFYSDEAAATKSRATDDNDHRKGLRSIHVDVGAESFEIAQRGRVVIYSLTAPPDEIAAYRKLLHRMWDGMQKGFK